MALTLVLETRSRATRRKRYDATACLWRYCHGRATEATELYCPTHAKVVDENLATIALFKPWTVVCWICSSRREESWTGQIKDVWVKSGWLRCDRCGSGTVGVESFDARDNGKATVVRDVDVPRVRLVH